MSDQRVLKNILPRNMLENNIASTFLNIFSKLACIHSKQYRFFNKNLSVLLPCNPKRTLQGFSWGCMVIVLHGKEPLFLRVFHLCWLCCGYTIRLCVLISDNYISYAKSNANYRSCLHNKLTVTAVCL